MSRSAIDPKDPPPSLEEQYACATTTSDLGLPRGDASGAQGILAAAAWTEVHLGSALRRLRAQWEAERPRLKGLKTVEQFTALGMKPKEARRAHRDHLRDATRTHYRQRLLALARLRELPEARIHLTMQAADWGIEEPDVKALTILNQWVEGRQPSFGADGLRLMAYLDDCAAHARAALVRGMRGHTKHEVEIAELRAIRKELGLD